MKLLILFILISCDTLDLYKYVIITEEGRWICDKEVDVNIYSTCVHEQTGEVANSINSGNHVVLEIKKE